MDWWLAMFDLELYMDDSGTHEGSQITVAACYIASPGRWKVFVRDWNKVLKRERIEAFHMTDFMARPERGVLPYCNWNQTRKDGVYRELATIINKHVLCGFAYAVPTLAFRVHMPARFKKESASTPFTYAVQCVLGLVELWYSEHGDQRTIKYIFEDRKGKGEIMQIAKIFEEREDSAKKLGFRNDLQGSTSYLCPKYTRPLQSADILAWNMRNHMENVVLKGLPNAPPNIHPYFDQLCLHGPVRLSFSQNWQVKEASERMQEYEKITSMREYHLPRKKLKKVGSLPNDTP
jgi:hypothetical protein